MRNSHHDIQKLKGGKSKSSHSTKTIIKKKREREQQSEHFDKIIKAASK